MIDVYVILEKSYFLRNLFSVLSRYQGNQADQEIIDKILAKM